MKKVILKAITSLMLLSLISCGPGKRKSESVSEINKSKFPLEWISEEPGIKGGTFKVAIVSNSQFKGIFNPVLSSDNIDSRIHENIYESVLLTDANFNVTDKGPGSLSVDVDNKVLTLKLREGMKWSDGEPMTVDDIIFSYEVLAHPDYTGTHFSSSYRLVEGIEDYHEGKADKISGLEKVSDTELRIHVKEVAPTVLTGLGGINSDIIPKHYLKDIPVKDLEKSDRVRLNPVGNGKYIVKQVIPGESVEFIPNPYYYNKEAMPKVDKLIIKVIPESSVIASMKSGEYDVYQSVPPTLYDEFKDLSNMTIVGNKRLAYSYLGFNLGKWDNKKGEIVTNTNAKLYDLNLRKALLYAMNVEEVTKYFNKGLYERANSNIPPVFEKYYNSEKRFSYDPEKAKELLDKAGYKDIDGDGIREDKNGKPFEIHLAFMASGETSEPISKKYIQDWANVGIKVTLSTGRLIEFNSFYDKVQANDDSIDMWVAGWTVGTALDLTGLYTKKSKFNFARISSEKNEELINKTQSIEGVKNPQFRIDAVKEWEKNYMENVLGMAPLTFQYILTPVNKRVKRYSAINDNSYNVLIPEELTQKQAYKAK